MGKYHFGEPYDPLKNKSEEELEKMQDNIRKANYSRRDIWRIFGKALLIVLPIIAVICLIYFSLLLLFP